MELRWVPGIARPIRNILWWHLRLRACCVFVPGSDEWGRCLRGPSSDWEIAWFDCTVPCQDRSRIQSFLRWSVVGTGAAGLLGVADSKVVADELFLEEDAAGQRGESGTDPRSCLGVAVGVGRDVAGDDGAVDGSRRGGGTVWDWGDAEDRNVGIVGWRCLEVGLVAGIAVGDGAGKAGVRAGVEDGAAAAGFAGAGSGSPR